MFGVPVVTCLRAFFTCTQGCGCDEHPALPAPSSFEGREIDAELGHLCSESAKTRPLLFDKVDRLIAASRGAVGWAKARMRRAHRSSTVRVKVGTLALCPPYILRSLTA
jgi:hypothetical protein